jgi:hypothetical protein
MQLILKEKPFALKSAKLSAAIPDPYWSRMYNPTGDTRLVWFLEVEAEPETEGEMWAPSISHENLHFPIRRWMDVVGQEVEWSEPYEEKSGAPNGRFYVFEHQDIPRARLQFLERNGVTFRFDWEGICDVFGDEEYDQNVPFSVSGWAEFTDIVVRGSESDTSETLRARLAEYLDPQDFTQGPLCCEGTRYVSGVKMAHAAFIPIAPTNA